MQLQGAVEAILFSYGEAIQIKKISDLTKSSNDDVILALDTLSNHYNERGSGLIIMRHNDTAQLITSPKFNEMVVDMVKNEFQENLTPAAEETLAIIAYAGPLTRSDIEHIRGANSSFTVRNLLMRGLIERASNPKRPNTYLYALSSDCFRHLGITDPKSLPEYEKYKNFSEKIFERVENEQKNTEV